MEHFLGWDSVEELIRAPFPDQGLEPHRSVSDAVELIHTWALLGDPISQRAGKVSESWVKIGQLIRAASQLAAAESVTLEELLQTSDQRLGPLRDPFCVDFGLHQWLHADREPSYSDWLAWLLGVLEDPALLFRLLGISPSTVQGLSTGRRPQVQREFAIKHSGQQYFLDILVRYPGSALIVIEVKVTSAEDAVTEKQRHYVNWMRGEPEPASNRHAILIVTDSDQEVVEGFDVRRWRDISLGIHRMLPELAARSGWVVAAMALAFAGAVEQNLLDLPGQPLEAVRGGWLLNLGESISYLEGPCSCSGGTMQTRAERSQELGEARRKLLESGGSSIPRAMAAIAKFHREVYNACKRALERNIDKLQAVLGTPIDKDQFKPHPASEKWEDLMSVDGNNWWFGAELAIKKTGSLCCYLWWTHGDDDALLIRAVASISLEKAEQRDRLFAALKKASAARVQRESYEIFIESNLSPSDFAHLNERLDALMSDWTSLLKRAKLKTK